MCSAKVRSSTCFFLLNLVRHWPNSFSLLVDWVPLHYHQTWSHCHRSVPVSFASQHAPPHHPRHHPFFTLPRGWVSFTDAIMVSPGCAPLLPFNACMRHYTLCTRVVHHFWGLPSSVWLFFAAAVTQRAVSAGFRSSVVYAQQGKFINKNWDKENLPKDHLFIR